MRSLTARIAVVLAALFLLAAAAVVLVPISSDGAKCGSLVSPDWTEEQVDDLGPKFERLGASDQASSVYRNGRVCDQSRSTRWVVVGVAGGLAVVIPLAVLFIGGARRREA